VRQVRRGLSLAVGFLFSTPGIQNDCRVRISQCGANTISHFAMLDMRHSGLDGSTSGVGGLLLMPAVCPLETPCVRVDPLSLLVGLRSHMSVEPADQALGMLPERL
jgi:hypothetical protein